MHQDSSITEARSRFENAINPVLSAFAQSGIETGEQVTPPMLADAARQVLSVMEKYDGPAADTPDDAEQLADYALGFFLDLSVWADRLQQKQSQGAFNICAVAVADWLCRHHGQIKTLDPVVNGLAQLANGQSEPEALAATARLMSRVIDAAQARYASDLEGNDPRRPWRILLLNHGITASRAQDLEEMRRAFEQLLHHLPQDAAGFFTEGLQQAERSGFHPDTVALLQEYASKVRGALH